MAEDPVNHFIPVKVTVEPYPQGAINRLERRVDELERRLSALKVEPVHGYVVAPIFWPRR